MHLTAGRGMRAIGAPGIILDICKSGKSALVQNILTHRIAKYNFSYLRRITTPILTRLPENWKNEIKNLDRVCPRDSSSAEENLGESQEEPGPFSYSQEREETPINNEEGKERSASQQSQQDTELIPSSLSQEQSKRDERSPSPPFYGF